MNLNQTTKLNTALALLRLGGECFGQHGQVSDLSLPSAANEAERRAVLERFCRWWNERTMPFLAEVDKLSSLPFSIYTGYCAWAAVPRRAFSPEVDYGVNWGLLSPRDWPRWRTSFVVATGEIYAVLGQVEPTREAAEKALKGWADGEMTLLNLAERFEPPEVNDPVAEAAEELKRCGSALRRIRLARDQAKGSGNIDETLTFINAQLREAGFPSTDEDPHEE